jgi:hypothetical protein
MHSISSRGQPTRGDPPAWWLGEVLTTAHRKKLSRYETFERLGPGLILWGQVAGCCECGNEPSGSIKRGEFLD